MLVSGVWGWGGREGCGGGDGWGGGGVGSGRQAEGSLLASTHTPCLAARGLAYLHNRKPSPIIHRDLKPGNLMLFGSQYQDQASVVFDTGIVKLADFGL